MIVSNVPNFEGDDIGGWDVVGTADYGLFTTYQAQSEF